MNNIKKSYGGSQILDGLTLDINEAERVGVVGPNGSGKTTLFKLLSGIEKQDDGDIFIKKGTKIGYLEQIPTFCEELTVQDVLRQAFADLMPLQDQLIEWEKQMVSPQSEKELELLLEKYGRVQEEFQRRGGYEVDRLIDNILNGLKIMPLKLAIYSQLSGGQKTKVGLGHLLLTQPDVLLLDEPTNHLDIPTVEWLEEYLKDYRGTILIISHDRVFLDEVVVKIIEVEDGQSHVYHGNYTYYVDEKERRLLAEFAAYQEQQKKIQKMKETIKRLKDWANRANPPNDGMHRRAKSMEKALERMEKLNRPKTDPKTMNLEFELTDRSGKDVLYFEEVSHAFGGTHLFEKLNMQIQIKEHIALVGPNGCGKSTLLKFITQELEPNQGKVHFGVGIKVGYLSQHVFSKETNQTVLDAFRDEVTVSMEEARHILARFLFYGESVFRKVGSLSGGERMRLKLAQLMYQDINFLVLDEPTNHLDLDSREVLEEAVNQFKGTVLAVSHDRFFLNKCFPITFWMENKTVKRYEGIYSEVKKKKMTDDLSKLISEPSKKGRKEEKPIQNQKIKSHAHLQEELESEIVSIEKQMENLISLMEGKGSSVEELTRLHCELEAQEQSRALLYQKLEDLLEN